ncbi:MAG: YggS family pyridoxal phosphate-dependent enzyme [Polyangiaceae bacterium]|nr:YggS family pyridoxal phosphate-dependent enzyme [Polyangiaceae bacterium]
MSIVERVTEVRARIEAATIGAGRTPGEVTLVAVSKLMPAALVREAYAAGLRDFGENYVQELVGKAAELADLTDLRWHLIGHLQRNKAQKVVLVASAVASVDSIALAVDLGRRSTMCPVPPPRRLPEGSDGRLVVLVEVNLGGEAQKSGCSPAGLGALLEAVDREPGLALRGLMTVPPYTDDPSAARPYFDELAALRESHGGAARLPILSMGMTHDLEPAIAAGATQVRVGTAIFGARTARPTQAFPS